MNKKYLLGIVFLVLLVLNLGIVYGANCGATIDDTECGCSVDQDTVFTADLNCSSNPALYIGTSNVEVDGYGYTLYTRGTNNGIKPQGHSEITIKNLNFEHNQSGLTYPVGFSNGWNDKNNVVIDNCTFKNYWSAIHHRTSTSNNHNFTVKNSYFENNGYDINLNLDLDSGGEIYNNTFNKTTNRVMYLDNYKHRDIKFHHNNYINIETILYVKKNSELNDSEFYSNSYENISQVYSGVNIHNLYSHNNNYSMTEVLYLFKTNNYDYPLSNLTFENEKIDVLTSNPTYNAYLFHFVNPKPTVTDVNIYNNTINFSADISKNYFYYDYNSIRGLTDITDVDIQNNTIYNNNRCDFSADDVIIKGNTFDNSNVSLSDRSETQEILLFYNQSDNISVIDNDFINVSFMSRNKGTNINISKNRATVFEGAFWETLNATYNTGDNTSFQYNNVTCINSTYDKQFDNDSCYAFVINNETNLEDLTFTRNNFYNTDLARYADTEEGNISLVNNHGNFYSSLRSEVMSLDTDFNGLERIDIQTSDSGYASLYDNYAYASESGWTTPASITIETPTNNTIKERQNWDINVSLDNDNCYPIISIDGDSNQSMTEVNSTYYTHTSRFVQANHNYTYDIYCVNENGVSSTSGWTYLNITSLNILTYRKS